MSAAGGLRLTCGCRGSAVGPRPETCCSSWSSRHYRMPGAATRAELYVGEPGPCPPRLPVREDARRRPTACFATGRASP
jgi:hypothetical protein